MRLPKKEIKKLIREIYIAGWYIGTNDDVLEDEDFDNELEKYYQNLKKIIEAKD